MALSGEPFLPPALLPLHGGTRGSCEVEVAVLLPSGEVLFCEVVVNGGQVKRLSIPGLPCAKGEKPRQTVRRVLGEIVGLSRPVADADIELVGFYRFTDRRKVLYQLCYVLRLQCKQLVDVRVIRSDAHPECTIVGKAWCHIGALGCKEKTYYGEYLRVAMSPPN